MFKNKNKHKFNKTFTQKNDRSYEDESIKLFTPSSFYPLEALSLSAKYSPNNPNILVVTDESGQVSFIDVNKIEKKSKDQPPVEIKLQKKIYINHNSATIFDMDWHDDSKKILFGCGDRSCKMIDSETGKIILDNIIHQNSIRCIKSCQYNNNLFVSGGRDGNLVLWDTRQQRQEVIVESQYLVHDDVQEIHSFTGVSFYQDQNTVLSVQAGHNQINIWDLRKVKQNQPKISEKNGQKVKQKLQLNKNNQISNGENNIGHFYSFNESTALTQNMKRMHQQLLDFKSEKLHQGNICQGYKQQLLTKYGYLSQQLKQKEQINQSSIKGFTSLFISKSQQNILVNSIDNRILLYKSSQIDTQAPIIFSGHKSNYYIKSIISPCENYILSGSKDFNMYIWKNDLQQFNSLSKDSIKKMLQASNNNSQEQEQNIQNKSNICNQYLQPYAKLENIHMGDINCVDWSMNYNNYICSVGDDRFLYIWDSYYQ